MKKQLTLSIVIVIIHITMVSGQTMSSDTKLSSVPFVRLYPLELVMQEFRMGVEIPTAPKQAVVLDGSYFFGSNSTEALSNKQGWAIKLDYRFYWPFMSKGSRFFGGPNIMVKHQEYVKENISYAYAAPTNDSRQVYCVNMKVGVDIRLSQNNRARVEVFSGAGVRYKSKGIDYGFFSISDSPGNTKQVSGSKVWPNLLLGVALKL